MKHNRIVRFIVLSLLFLAFGLLPVTTRADEGIWLFNQFPKKLVRDKYGVQLTEQFLNNLRLASLRVLASGSFVSANGLIFTNHHVASDCIQQLSSAEHDYMANGFYAARWEDEQKCPGLEADVLLSIDDVTSKVNAGISPEMSSTEANPVRKVNMASIEKECAEATGNRCEVVTLYSGGEYHLYRYKTYSDIRLVFAPEVAVAAFGGDQDNFTYPRYCLDITFLRAYENNRPADTPNFLRWSKEGVKDGELTFVSGNPASTGRLDTVAQLDFFRDVAYPLVHKRLASLIQVLENFGCNDSEKRRIAADNLMSQQNSYKAYTGFLAALRDPKLMQQKMRLEQQLREAVARDPKMEKEFGSAWGAIAAAYSKAREFYKQYWLLETAATRGSELMGIGRGVLRLPEERLKPDGERLREYRDTALPSLERTLYANVPIDDSMEITVIGNYLAFLKQELGATHPVVRSLLGGMSPQQAARRYVLTTKLKDVGERKRLANNAEAVRISQDGIIRLVRILDGPARRLRKEYEDTVEATLRTEAAKIAQAQFALRGEDSYPDATFTLRLSFGPVRGYRNAAGQPIPYATTFRGLYQRVTGHEPFRLPKRWLRAKPDLNLDTPLNFVTTADTHGGNSGSPTVNTRGEVIGILFDGNLESLPNRFIYSEEQARSIHVASQGIIEALRKVYKVDRLIAELGM